MFRIAICDDESHFLDIEKKSVEGYLRQLRIEADIDCYQSGRTLLQCINRGKQYDLVFLDVEMPDISGMDIAKELCNICPALRIAFVSAHADYATLGYHVNAVRFILKLTGDIDLYIKECIDYVLKGIEYDNRRDVFDFTSGKKELYINDILYIRASKNYVQFILTDKCDKGIYKLRCPITKVTEMMDKYDFLSISPRESVNMKHVLSVNRYIVHMDDGSELKVSQKKYNDVKKRISLYKGAKI